jgi:hypothetical protein
MSFTNPLNAGQTLILGSLHSPNYVAGVSGWSINKNGTAQFNSVTIIGDRITLNGANNAQIIIQNNAVSVRAADNNGFTYPSTGVLLVSSDASGDGEVILHGVESNGDTGTAPSLDLFKKRGDGSTATLIADKTTVTGILQPNVPMNYNNIIFYSFGITAKTSTGLTEVLVDNTNGGLAFLPGHYYRFVMCGHATSTTSTSITPQIFLRDTGGGTARGFAGLVTQEGSNNSQFQVEFWVVNKTALTITRQMDWTLRSSAAGNCSLNPNPGGFPAPLMWYCEDRGATNPNSSYLSPAFATAL